VVAACGAAVVIRSVYAQVPGPTHSLTPVERMLIGRQAAEKEPEWRLKSERGFPGDCWSADDDYGASEYNWAREQAGQRGVPVIEILRAIDDDLHRFPVAPPRKSGACPCMPRPFYG
jgi:hypothetical protein